CDSFQRLTIYGNVILPMSLAVCCAEKKIGLMHFSTGCLFDENQEYCEVHKPLRGFGGHCGMYVGTKLMAEEIVSGLAQHYILRIRLPFDGVDQPKNYLSKLAAYETVYTHLNALSHRGDIVKAALDLWERRAPFGTYHLANEGSITALETAELLLKAGIMKKAPKFEKGVGSGCRLSIAKLLSTGVKIRPVHEAVEDAIKNWRAA